MPHTDDQSNQDKYFCGICLKQIAVNHKYIDCGLCSYRVHIKCTKIDNKTYENIKYREAQVCIKCKEEIFPFQKLTEQQFFLTSKSGLSNDMELLNLNIFPIERMKLFFKEINDISMKAKDTDENFEEINCNYVDIDSFDYKTDKNKLALFHLNIASVQKHKEELETILKMINLKFDVIGLTESKIRMNIDPLTNLNIEGYQIFSTTTEAEKGGAMIYVANHLAPKPLKKLEKIMYKPKQLESVFIEICNENKKYIIIGNIYRHPSMKLNDFNENFLDPLMEELSTKDKSVYLMGDFNIDLMKIDIDNNTAIFFDSMSSNLFAPHITHPTRVTLTTKSLIDNIFSNSSNFAQGEYQVTLH